MELLLESNFQDFQIVFEENESKNCLYGKAFEITCFGLGDDKTEYEYVSNYGSDGTTDIGQARVFFNFSYVWRGVWEGRIYFKDEEYWCNELKTIHELWEKIEVFCKEKITLANPDATFK